MTDNRDRIKQTGHMKHYMPLKMVLAMALFLAFIAHMREDLYTRFMAHPSLNALIIGTMIISLAAAFRNIFKVEAAAKLIRRLEKYEEEPSEESAKSILKKIRKKNIIINTFYLEGAIVDLKSPGHLRFTDNQSRIMKGKVGQRTSRMRHSVQYMAGVLVMLGLIGTFWGLLATITSVGEAMATIVESFSKSADGGGGQATGMVDFLRAISKPLQGMGIAFSASLFGLSGSLMTGLLNSFCGKGMDKFLEDFSNWIDARIPPPMEKKESLNPVEIIERHNTMVVTALEQALKGLAAQSQQMMSMFSQVVNEITEFSSQQAALTKQLTLEKRETMRLANTFEGGINALHANMSTLSESLAALPVLAREMRNDVQGINNLLLTSQQSMLGHQKLTSDQLVAAASQSTLLHNSLNQLFEGNRALTGVHTQIAEALENLHDDTIRQKDKIIEMVLVMQHILQAQLDPNHEIKKGDSPPALERL